MKIRKCLEFGKLCGLKTVSECVRNIEIHAGLLFPYSNLEKELEELYKDIKELEIDKDMNIEYLLSPAQREEKK